MSDVVVISADALRQLVREAVREELASGVASAAGDVLTRVQVAELLQVHPQVVTRYVRARGLKGTKIGRDWRFRRSDVNAWLERQP